VLVDTGSPGLRLLASALNGFSLPAQMDPNVGANAIVECLPFADGYTWGPVVTADVTIGGEMASAIPINIIDDIGTLEPAAPASCTSNGTDLGSLDDLGANGVLGVGLFSTDCGGYCEQAVSLQTQGFFYYSCSASSCAATSEPNASQVINPVAVFPKDNNGVILQLPAIPIAGVASDTGYLVFGIGTESNNALGGSTVFTTDGSGNLSTMFNGQTMVGFLDSGSNGLFFPDSSLPTCSGTGGISDFYCPSPSPSALLTATIQGQNGNSAMVSFQINDPTKVNNTFFAVDVGGPIGGIMGLGTNTFFDFGVPFFYGRTVFTAIQGVAADGTTGPYYAY
jgi:hypothetical protein